MNTLDTLSQLEYDLAWRLGEIKFLKNQISHIQKEEDQRTYRKSLVVMLYSHYEGFCKTAFSIYLGAINGYAIKCTEANYHIIAATLADVFRALDNPDKKSDIFRNYLPDDTKLHRLVVTLGCREDILCQELEVLSAEWQESELVSIPPVVIVVHPTRLVTAAAVATSSGSARVVDGRFA